MTVSRRCLRNVVLVMATLLQYSVRVIFSFLQDLIDKRRAFSTIQVYLAAIAACQVGFGWQTTNQHPLICCFMKGRFKICVLKDCVAASFSFGKVSDMNVLSMHLLCTVFLKRWENGFEADPGFCA